MSNELGAALERFERVMGMRFAQWFDELQPGLDDAGIERLREAVAPLLLPAQVEQLYRWRSGGDRGVFGGWRLQTPDQLIRWYRFCVDEMDQPPAWLPVFDDQIVNIVTLDLPGAAPSDTSVWFGDTHDTWVARVFDSIACLVHTVCDAAEAGVMTAQGALIGIEADGIHQSIDCDVWADWRQARCPGTYRLPDPPTGTYLERLPDPGWPAAWLASLGIDTGAMESTGPTRTVAELVAEAEAHPATGTIRGRVVTGSGSGRWWMPVVDDGSGQLVIECNPRDVVFSVPVGGEAEFDVVLETATLPEPMPDEDPRVLAMAERFRPALPRALAVAVRPLP